MRSIPVASTYVQYIYIYILGCVSEWMEADSSEGCLMVSDRNKGDNVSARIDAASYNILAENKTF